MSDRPNPPADVHAEARNILGDDASEWMHTPNRFFDHLAPADLMRSPEGAELVLRELRKPGAVQAFKLRTLRQL